MTIPLKTLAVVAVLGVTTYGAVAVASAIDGSPNDMAAQGMAVLPQPVRLLDTRDPGLDTAVPVGRGVIRLQTVDKPNWATAAFLNLTITNPQGPGFGVAWDCGTMPETSSVNFGNGETESNMAVVPLGGPNLQAFHGSVGEICIFTSVPADVVVDLQAWAIKADYWRIP